MSKNNKINWFWAHRRNTSLHHMSIFAAGLRSKGWKPVIDFWFDNQVYVGIPDKGVYIFYDKDQLNAKNKYKNIQDSVDSNKSFVVDYKKHSDRLFAEVFAQCDLIDKANLKEFNKEGLHKLYKDFIKVITVAPILTVQLWGIEAFWDKEYKIDKFLKQVTKSDKEYKKYKEILSINIGETVAFSEQKDFFLAASSLYKKEIIELFKNNNLASASKKLLNLKKENAIFENHIKKYEWVNTEYISGGWSREKWLDLFKKAILDKVAPQKRLDSILESFLELNKKRKEAIEVLNPPQNLRHSLDALAELIAQRDWSKGWFVKSLLSYSKLLDEISQRIGIDYIDIFNYSYEEIFNYFKEGKLVSKDELEERKNNGFVYIVNYGQPRIISGKKNIARLIKEEKISEPFNKIDYIKKFKGLSASRGKIQGIARVLEDASKISKFKKGEIIVTYMTTMEFTPIFRKAAAVVTDEGGMSCHAAIVSREFNLPCIVGTKIATRVIKTGNRIEVDADNGIVNIL